MAKGEKAKPGSRPLGLTEHVAAWRLRGLLEAGSFAAWGTAARIDKDAAKGFAGARRARLALRLVGYAGRLAPT